MVMLGDASIAIGQLPLGYKVLTPIFYDEIHLEKSQILEREELLCCFAFRLSDANGYTTTLRHSFL